MYDALSRMVQAQQVHIDLAERLRLLQRAGRAQAAAAPGPAAAAGGQGEPPLARPGGCTPRSAMPRPSRTTTTCPTRSTSGCSARPWPTPAPATRPGRHPGGGPGLQARPGGPEARPAPGDAAARRGLRLGRHGPARGPGVRRQGARRDPVRAAGGLGAAGHRGGGPGRAGRGPPPRLPRRARGRVRRGQLDRADRAHRQGPAARLLLLPVRQAAARGPAAEPLHHPAGQPTSPAAWSAGSSTATCSPTASWKGRATWSR